MGCTGQPPRRCQHDRSCQHTDLVGAGQHAILSSCPDFEDLQLELPDNPTIGKVRSLLSRASMTGRVPWRGVDGNSLHPCYLPFSVDTDRLSDGLSCDLALKKSLQ